MSLVVLTDFLKNKRLEVGLTQMEVAKELGYDSPQFVSNWERAMCYPPPDKFPQIAKLYKINDEVLIKLYLKYHEARVRKDVATAKARMKKGRH